MDAFRMPTIARVTCCALALAVCFLAAHPADANPRRKARRLFRQGIKLYKRGMHLDALQKFRKARKIYPSYKIDLNIGGVLDSMGRRTEAAVYFEKFLINATKAPRPVIRSAQDRLAQLKKKLASVKVTCQEEGATVLMDGKSMGKVPLELPIYVEPGKHLLTAEKPGLLPFRQQQELVAGQHITVDIRLEEKPAPVKKPASQPAPKKPVVVAPPVPAGPDEALLQKHRSRSLLAYTTLGVGLALAAGAGLLCTVGWVSGEESYSAYKDEVLPELIGEHWQDVKTSRNMITAGYIMAGAAAVSLGVSIFAFATRPRLEQPARATSALPSIRLAPTAGGGLLSISGGF